MMQRSLIVSFLVSLAMTVGAVQKAEALSCMAPQPAALVTKGSVPKYSRHVLKNIGHDHQTIKVNGGKILAFTRYGEYAEIVVLAAKKQFTISYAGKTLGSYKVGKPSHAKGKTKIVGMTKVPGQIWPGQKINREKVTLDGSIPPYIRFQIGLNTFVVKGTKAIVLGPFDCGGDLPNSNGTTIMLTALYMDGTEAPIGQTRVK